MIREKGSVLIFTLWVLIILAILTITLSYRASSDVRLAKYESSKIRATYLARAGAMKMLAELAKDQNGYDSLNEDWNITKDNPKEFKLGKETVFYGASDEMSRLNLNSTGLAKEHLINLGIDDEIVSENIVSYKNEKKDNNRFEFIEELFLVNGMTREIYLKIKDFVTIYREDDFKLNINTASEEVLRAVLGNEGLVLDILDHRKGPDGEVGTEDDGFKDPAEISTIDGLNTTFFTISSNFFRVWAEAPLSQDKEIVKGVEAVVDRSRKIHHWKEY